MRFLLEVLIVLHFVGLAALLGGFLVQVKTIPRIINGPILYGAITQLVTGLLIVGIHASDPSYSTAPDDKIGVKLLVLIGILVLALINRKKPEITTTVWALIGGLTIANIVIAVFWH